MKIRLVGGIFLHLFCGYFGIIASVESFSDSSLIPTVSWQEISDNMAFIQGKEQPRWYVVNVLPRDICSDCCIPGSINIPTHLLNPKNQKLKRWPRSRKIIIYCAGDDCPLSKYAYQAFRSLGFTDVWVLDGGIRGWKRNMLPTIGRCKSGYLN